MKREQIVKIFEETYAKNDDMRLTVIKSTDEMLDSIMKIRETGTDEDLQEFLYDNNKEYCKELFVSSFNWGRYERMAKSLGFSLVTVTAAMWMYAAFAKEAWHEYVTDEEVIEYLKSKKGKRYQRKLKRIEKDKIIMLNEFDMHRIVKMKKKKGES